MDEKLNYEELGEDYVIGSRPFPPLIIEVGKYKVEPFLNYYYVMSKMIAGGSDIPNELAKDLFSCFLFPDQEKHNRIRDHALHLTDIIYEKISHTVANFAIDIAYENKDRILVQKYVNALCPLRMDEGSYKFGNSIDWYVDEKKGRFIGRIEFRLKPMLWHVIFSTCYEFHDREEVDKFQYPITPFAYELINKYLDKIPTKYRKKEKKSNRPSKSTRIAIAGLIHYYYTNPKANPDKEAILDVFGKNYSAGIAEYEKAKNKKE